ncbi:McbB family protein [Salmonella enterica subsp. enterica serovar Sundsvall]|nr:McbB family protein [Salmonella enterica subsp. enterica serovar Sundsvall]EEM1821073.1 McbB family protein [Salmonella enterica subsp. enterica serovar Abaetetuba]
MINILPFEIISRNTKTLLITYISSVDIAHDGMKKVLESLQTLRGIISESNLDELLDSEVIDKEKGKEFLVTTGVINKMTASSLWDNSVIITDVPQHFSNAREQWLADGILVSHITDVKDTNFDLSDSTLIWLHLEKYQPEIIKSVYTKFENNQGVAFIQSYYLKEAFRIDGVYSPVLGTPCHFCHIERWLNREEKSFRRNEMSWANLLQLLKKHQMSLPALALSETERGFSQHLIKRRLQELIGTSLVKSHVDTFMSSVSADLITCVLSKEPVIHWQACGCLER